MEIPWRSHPPGLLMRMAWHLRPTATTLRIWPSASARFARGFFSNRDQVFFSMERNGDFMGFRGNSVKFIKDNETGDARICHLSFHIFPSIQWGNNPSCWIKNKFFHLTPKLKGSRSTVSSVSDRKKQFGQTGSPKPLKQLVCLKHATVQGTCSEHDDKPRPPV